MRTALLLFLTTTLLALLTGCAAIDFLDGKHFAPAPDREPPRYGGSTRGGGGGGHSH